MSDTSLIAGLSFGGIILWLWIYSLERRIKKLEDKSK